jgi:NAD(P)H-dependent FMN reductase
MFDEERHRAPDIRGAVRLRMTYDGARPFDSHAGSNSRGDPMSELFIPVILGTARPGRRSAAVAALVADALKARGTLTQIVDVADYDLTGTGASGDGRLDTYRETVAAADGFVIVSPEYNHGYPGELKLLLDSDYAGYVRKPVGFVSVSAGMLGGARVVEQLRQIAAAFRMVPVAPGVHVSNVEDALDARGGFAEATLDAVLQDMLDEIEWFATRLSREDTTS